VDSPAEDDVDIDAALDEWLRKESGDEGVDDPYAGELEMIRQFQQNPTSEAFSQLHSIHAPLINRASSRYVSSTTLPKAAVKSFALQRYTHALQTYDPDRGAKFNTYLFKEMQRLGRYTAKYSNIARVGSEERAGLIGLLQDTERNLNESLGRPPTDDELSDEMTLAASDVAELKKKMHRITPKNVGTLRKELRADFTAEQAGGETEIAGDSKYRRQAVFLHGSLNPEQQLVLEHTFEGFGKPVIEDDAQLGQQINMSPQKVRALKAQIRKRIERTY
jgi:DNA-directed RNA polymerase specialized sigma subunit